jgi:PAS domain S-box-containing protein
MRSPALWLYLLGAVTVLLIVLRRVLHRQIPLNDEIYSKQVAIDHVHSCVAWVRADGLIGSVNPALSKTVRMLPRELVAQPWETIFPLEERAKLQEAHRQALLMGKIRLETQALRPDGTLAKVRVLLVTIHDHQSRLVGHYCLMEDLTREFELEQQIEKLTSALTPTAAGPAS